MKISTILDRIDSGHMALPEFQRGYVWNRKQVRELFDSLYRRHPVGGLLVWAAESNSAKTRGDGDLAAGMVDLLLDGQQRITSLYGVVRGQKPEFFDGNPQAFNGLYFHVGEETFSFYQPTRMKSDSLWIDVSALMKQGVAGITECNARWSAFPEHVDKASIFMTRLLKLVSITDIDIHIEEVTGTDKPLDIVVDIFNRVNSGGTKLSKGDLALAKICADWPEGRSQMKAQLEIWQKQGYNFNLDWLLRSVNTVLTGEAKFSYLHEKSAEEIQEGLKRAIKAVNTALNMIGGRLGLDHDRVLFGRGAIPVMACYLDQRNGPLDERERDKLLFWYFQAGMRGRFSGSVETKIDQDLALIKKIEGGLDRLIEQLRLGYGGLQVESGYFDAWSLGARFYPVLYMLTRMGEAKDWGTGLPLKVGLPGDMNKLEVHHIFPKSQLYSRDYQRSEVNALANFCFLTKDTNLSIRNRLPEKYFPEIEEKHEGALQSQWIPMDPELWRIENYRDFLEARRVLLAEETNARLAELLHGDTQWLHRLSASVEEPPSVASPEVIGGISSEEEEQELEVLNTWIEEQGFPQGQLAYAFADEETGEQKAVFDLAWPEGIQPGLSQPVAVLLNESSDVIALASGAGYRCFTTPTDFRRYVEGEFLLQG